VNKQACIAKERKDPKRALSELLFLPVQVSKRGQTGAEERARSSQCTALQKLTRSPVVTKRIQFQTSGLLRCTPCETEGAGDDWQLRLLDELRAEREANERVKRDDPAS
jgi:hypothetical protein